MLDEVRDRVFVLSEHLREVSVVPSVIDGNLDGVSNFAQGMNGEGVVRRVRRVGGIGGVRRVGSVGLRSWGNWLGSIR